MEEIQDKIDGEALTRNFYAQAKLVIEEEVRV